MKLNVTRYLVPAALLTLAMAGDILVQRFEVVSEWDSLDVAFRAVRFGLFFGAWAFLFGRRAQWAYVPLWCLFCGVLAIECVARFNFGMVLGGDWVMILLASSGDELREFSRQFSIPVVISVALALPLVLTTGVWALRKTPYPRVSLRSVCVGLACLAPFAIYDIKWQKPLNVFMGVITLRLPVDSVRHWGTFSEIAKSATSPDLPTGLRLEAPAEQSPFGVVVIGESATRNNWGLYGYARPTTPCLKALENELIVFGDATATHGVTGDSLRMVFTEATMEEPDQTRCMFVQKCVAVGYDCALLSAQTRWGRWDSVETLLFSGCSEKWYLAEHPAPEKDRPRYDDALLPPLFERLDKAATNCVPRLLFVHLMGSHAIPCYRYPSTRAVYPRYEGDHPPGFEEKPPPMDYAAIDVYDNSIAFTDSFLGDVLERLKRMRRPVFFVYFSDHGETPRAPNWRHLGDPDLTAVPLVVWLSPVYRAAFPKVVTELVRQSREPLRLDRLQTILLPLARVVSGSSLTE